MAGRAQGWMGFRAPQLNGIPVTTPARTLLDLAGVLPAQMLRRVVRQALGERVLRMTWRQTMRQPQQTLACIRAALADPTPTAPATR